MFSVYRTGSKSTTVFDSPPLPIKSPVCNSGGRSLLTANVGHTLRARAASSGGVGGGRTETISV